LLRKFIGTAGEGRAALLGGCAFDPFGLQLFSAQCGLPPGISDDGDPQCEPSRSESSIYRKSMADAGMALDFIEMALTNLPA